MSDTITIHNGGEAPHASRSIAGDAVAGGDQGSIMQQNGGQAPEPGTGSQQVTNTNVQPKEITDGDPPLGGGVHIL